MISPSLSRREVLGYSRLLEIVDDIFGNDLHAKRVASLTDATLGVLSSESLAIHLIGQGLAQKKDLDRKSCIKQVDRMLGNVKWTVMDLFHCYVPYLLGGAREALVAMDWTEFDSDGHSVLMLSHVTGHGRALPLVWITVSKEDLKGNRNLHEEGALLCLKECLPEGVQVTILADRGFGDTSLYRHLKEDLGFDYIIRFKGNILVSQEDVEKRAQDWVPSGGRARALLGAKVTSTNSYVVPKSVFIQQKDMKEAWCLASSREDLAPLEIVSLYGKRWGIECGFKDLKDLRCGLGLKKIHTKSMEKRNKLILVASLAILLMTLLGAAGDAAGLEKYIKANTEKKRTYSFFRQGQIYYDLLLGMKTERLRLLIRMFNKLLLEHQLFRTVLGVL